MKRYVCQVLAAVIFATCLLPEAVHATPQSVDRVSAPQYEYVRVIVSNGGEEMVVHTIALPRGLSGAERILFILQATQTAMEGKLPASEE